MNDAKYIENETQTPVLVSSAYGWAPLGVVMIVTYPSGHRYAVRDADFKTHFTVVTPQEIFVTGSFEHVARPTTKQLELQENGS